MSVNNKIPNQFKKRKDLLFDPKTETIINKNPYYCFLLRPNGYIPRSGIILRDYLIRNIKHKINRALEIGVGELSFIPISLVKQGLIKRVDALEIDPIAIKWSNKNISYNKLVGKIKIFSNWLKITGEYDLIYSNPPQMAVPTNKSLHDDGGTDGYQIINRILNLAKRKLKKNGKLILLLFDFLNVETAYNKEQTLIEKMNKIGFSVKIKKRVPIKIRPGGRTEKNIEWIKKQYPLFNFKRNNSMGHSILIVEAKYLGIKNSRT